MKVCTDACLFGAWVSTRVHAPKHILDIGSGTGLLMMMLAQHFSCPIDGIEINAECFEQLKENIHQNEWRERLHVIHADAREYSFEKKYDLIISNPPFFENDLLSHAASEQLAKHSTAMSFDDLVKLVQENLSADGIFAVLLPYHRYESFFLLAKNSGLYPIETMLVKQTRKHDYFRAMVLLSRHPVENNVNEISIRGKNEYSDEFIALLKGYYLSL